MFYKRVKIRTFPQLRRGKKKEKLNGATLCSTLLIQVMCTYSLLIPPICYVNGDRHRRIQGRPDLQGALTVPELTYFFFLHFFRGLSTWVRKIITIMWETREGTTNWSHWDEGWPGQPRQGWSSHLIYCKLVLGLAQLPVAGGELTNEVMAATRPGVGE